MTSDLAFNIRKSVFDQQGIPMIKGLLQFRILYNDIFNSSCSSKLNVLKTSLGKGKNVV
jgi:hypothetical protein